MRADKPGCTDLGLDGQACDSEHIAEPSLADITVVCRYRPACTAGQTVSQGNRRLCACRLLCVMHRVNLHYPAPAEAVVTGPGPAPCLRPAPSALEAHWRRPEVHLHNRRGRDGRGRPHQRQLRRLHQRRQVDDCRKPSVIPKQRSSGDSGCSRSVDSRRMGHALTATQWTSVIVCAVWATSCW